MKFWYYLLLTITVEAAITYLFFYYTKERGFVYLARWASSTEAMTYPLCLLFASALFSACSLGIFRKSSDEVQTLPAFFLSFVQHPIPLGSVLLFFATFFVL